jgi:hypothetical protein
MANKKEGPVPGKTADKEQLQTENPISEKDEVKQAEERLNKKTDPSVAADLKNREHKEK